MRICAAAFIGAAMMVAGSAFSAETSANNGANYHELPLNVPNTGKVILTVQQKIDQDANGSANHVDLTYTYENTYTAKDETYQIHPVLLSSKLNSFNGNVPPPGVDTSALTGSMLLMNGIGYTASTDFGPTRIEDMAGLKANYRAFVTKVASQDPANAKQADLPKRMDEAVEKVFGLMTPESAANTFLPELVLLSWPHNTGLVLGEKAVTKAQETVPLGGLVDVNISMSLISWDEEKDTAIITWDSVPEAASLAVAFKEVIPKIVAYMGVQADQLPADSSLILERHCRYTMVISSGLAREAECTTQKGFIIGGVKQLETHSYNMSEKLQN
ncbi:MAG: hypothetical protein QM647_00620 [Asticcacaulis sp.]|uniref:hypothetical protein n=1 Tax=Asticcacaulis sp. TaxID=1872648 RepID=UPI0039E5A525